MWCEIARQALIQKASVGSCCMPAGEIRLLVPVTHISLLYCSRTGRSNEGEHWLFHTQTILLSRYHVGVFVVFI